MNNLEEIKEAVRQLPQREQHVLQDWLEKLTHPTPETISDATLPYGSTQMHTIRAAIERLNAQEQCELCDRLNGSDEEETREMLAAIDEGLHSLETEPTFTIEEVRREMASWLTR